MRNEKNSFGYVGDSALRRLRIRLFHGKPVTMLRVRYVMATGAARSAADLGRDSRRRTLAKCSVRSMAFISAYSVLTGVLASTSTPWFASHSCSSMGGRDRRPRAYTPSPSRSRTSLRSNRPQCSSASPRVAAR